MGREFMAYCSTCKKQSYHRLLLPVGLEDEAIGTRVYCKNNGCLGWAHIVRELDR